MTPRTQAALNAARQALAQAARTQHDHRHGHNRCPTCNPATDHEEHWTDL